MTTKEKFDLNTKLVQRIIDALESGVAPWVKDWATMSPMNPSTGTVYRGVNALLLAMDGRDTQWITPAYAKKNGIGFKGAKCAQIVFYKRVLVKDKQAVKAADGTTPKRPIFLMRGYNVLPLCECDQATVPAKWLETATRPVVRDDTADEVIRGANIPYEEVPTVRGPCYSPRDDMVRTPPIEQFHGDLAYYSAMFHEFGHATGHESRLGRNLDTAKGSGSYSAEELVAEICSAVVMGRLGLEYSIENTAAYCKGWAERLSRTDTVAKSVVSATSKAFDAAEWILAGGKPDPKTD